MTKSTKIYLIIIFSQIVLMLCLDYYIESRIEHYLSKEMSIHEFSDTLLQLFSNLNIFRILDIVAVSVMNILLILLIKPMLQNRLQIYYLLTAILVFEPLQIIYKFTINNEHYNIEKILGTTKENLVSLKTKTYLYKHFKNRGDKEGLDLVLHYAKKNLQSQESDFLITHRKDKEFPQLFKK